MIVGENLHAVCRAALPVGSKAQQVKRSGLVCQNPTHMDQSERASETEREGEGERGREGEG